MQCLWIAKASNPSKKKEEKKQNNTQYHNKKHLKAFQAR